MNILNSLDGYKTYIGIAITIAGLLLGQPLLVTIGTGLIGVGLTAKLQKLIDAIKALVDPVDQPTA